MGVFKSWTDFHEQMLALVKMLQEKGFLEDFCEFKKETSSFNLKKVSINWELEWIFPFIFNRFPPYYQEMAEIQLYVFSFLCLPLPIIISIVHFNLVLLMPLLVLAIFLLFSAILRSRNIIQLHFRFKHVQEKLSTHQQEKLLQLLFSDQDVDPGVLHVNRENLDRLRNERSVPRSFLVLPLTVILPLFSTIIGYVILLSG